MVADECLSPSDFLVFWANSLKLLYEIKGIACFCCSFCIFRKEFLYACHHLFIGEFG